MEGYSVSNQCMALVKDNCLVPTKDVPELGFVRESSDKQYVPDVYYKVCKMQFLLKLNIQLIITKNNLDMYLKYLSI